MIVIAASGVIGCMVRYRLSVHGIHRPRMVITPSISVPKHSLISSPGGDYSLASCQFLSVKVVSSPPSNVPPRNSIDILRHSNTNSIYPHCILRIHIVTKIQPTMPSEPPPLLG